MAKPFVFFLKKEKKQEEKTVSCPWRQLCDGAFRLSETRIFTIFAYTNRKSRSIVRYSGVVVPLCMFLVVKRLANEIHAGKQKLEGSLFLATKKRGRANETNNVFTFSWDRLNALF